ncbi:MAG: hypothetical protein GY797_04220 [Deltaproteobacteria bacterium]|nr:hypothetical protein [Deltaproteobacteria bacterium]
MKALKYYSFSMPLEMFRELRQLGHEMDYPIAELIRNSLSHVLKDKEKRVKVLKGEQEK